MDIVLIVAILFGIIIVRKMCADKGEMGHAPGTSIREQPQPVARQQTVKPPSGKQKKTRKHFAAGTAAVAAGAGAVGLTALAASSAFGRSGQSRPDDWLTDPAYWFMPGNIYYSEQLDSDNNDDDWYSDPSYSWMPGNIYYQDSCDSTGGMDSSSPDYINDPIYSYMDGNIFHQDDSWNNSTPISGMDDDWTTITHVADEAFETTSFMTSDDSSDYLNNSYNDTLSGSDDDCSSSCSSDDSCSSSSISDDDWCTSSSSSRDDNW